ncbi:MAG: hypothetical protein RIS84_1408 [Pseudomonadota bacterium]
MRMRSLQRGAIVLLCVFSTGCSLIKASDFGGFGFTETERGDVITINEVFFDFDKSDLLPLAERKMDKIAEVVQTNSTRNILISGHTDFTGEHAYNQILSERRANTVLNALIKRGVHGARLKARGFGETQPIASNNTIEGRQQNRRVEVLILNEGLGFND